MGYRCYFFPTGGRPILPTEINNSITGTRSCFAEKGNMKFAS